MKIGIPFQNFCSTPIRHRCQRSSLKQIVQQKRVKNCAQGEDRHSLPELLFYTHPAPPLPAIIPQTDRPTEAREDRHSLPELLFNTHLAPQRPAIIPQTRSSNRSV
ncbi:MAG: hypothetical protein IT423_15885 [Pirellulaceae bacterium]|nr:hypothetical protein [Pirellulaceae bacterium]